MGKHKDTLLIDIVTTGDGRVKATLAGTSAELGKMDKAGQGVTRTLGNMRGLLAGLAAGALTAAIKGSIDHAAALDATAQKLGLTTDALQVYRYAAGQTNVSNEKMEMGLQRLLRKAGDAARGIGESAKLFDELGVAVVDSNGNLRDGEEIIVDFARAVASLEGEQAQLSATVQGVDSESADLVRTFRAMSSGTRDFKKEAEAAGLIISKELIEKTAETDAKMNALEQVVSTKLTVAMVELAPAIDSVATALLNSAQGWSAFFSAVKGGLNDPDGGLENPFKKALDRMRDLMEENQDLQRIAAGNGSWWEESFLYSPERAREKLEKNVAEIARIRSNLLFKINEGVDDDGAPVGGTGGNPNPNPKPGPYTPSGTPTADETTEAQRRQAELYDLIHQEALDLQAAERELNNERERALGIIKSMDPGSYYRDRIAEVQRYKEMFPDLADTLSEVELDLHSQWDDMAEGGVDAAKKVDDAWQDLGLTFTSAFEDAIVEGKNFSDVLKGLEQDILRIVVRKSVTEPLGNAISGMTGDLFGNLFGAATGADFVVPGSGGLDTKLLPISSGERVQITPPGQSSSPGGNVTNLTMNISTPDVESFRMSERHILQDMRTALSTN